jgi:hypothetical protein
MSVRIGNLVSLFTLALVAAAAGCGGSTDATTRGTFGGGGGASGGTGAGTPGVGGSAAGTPGVGSSTGQGGSTGFYVPDSSVHMDSSGPAPTQFDAACAADKRDSTPVKKDIIIAFDNSSSMACDVSDAACTNAPPGGGPTTRIAAVREAITAFVNAPGSANVGVGLTCFPPADPLAEQCNQDYSKPDVPIAPASTNAAQFGTVLGMLTPHLNTPTEQVLTGSYKAAQAYIAANPGRSVAVVLVTDGMPFACNNDKTGAASAALAKTAFEGTPSIETYVVGLGKVDTLDAIALAGTGGVTHYIAANADATQKILDLLKAVSTMITCDYTIPTNGKTLDYGAVNVQAKLGPTGTFDKVLYVTGGSKCAAAKGGWFYDVTPNPPVSTPHTITLCPETCNPLKATEGSALQVLIGCATEPATIY